MHLREIFYDTSIFQQSSMICNGRHLGYTHHTLAVQQHGGQVFDANTFFLLFGHLHLKLQNSANE